MSKAGHPPLQGSLLIPVAKVYFVITSYVVYMSLARILGAELFGVYGLVIGIVSVFNMVFITGTIQSVSKYVSENPGRANAVKRSALQIQLILGGSVALAFFALSPQMARMLRDASLTPYFRIASSIILCYALYAVFIGQLNGQRRFTAQALLDMSYSTLKALLIPGFALLGWAVHGAVGGFALAALTIMTVVIVKYGIPVKAEYFARNILLKFSLTVMGVAVVMNLIQQTDLILLKALALPLQANLLAGYYTASLTIARVPYMILISLGLVIFPLVSRSTHEEKSEETKLLIRQGLRTCLILTVPIVALFSAAAPATLDLLYPAEFRPAAPALEIIAFGYLGLTLLMMCVTIISSTGHPQLSLAFLLMGLIIQVIFGFVLIPDNPLRGAAWSTTIAAFTGTAAAGLWLQVRYRAFFTPLSVLRISISAGAIYLWALNFNQEGVGLILQDMILFIAYFAILHISRELTAEELSRFFRALGWKKKTSP